MIHLALLCALLSGLPQVQETASPSRMAQSRWTVLDDFEGRERQWSAESVPSANVAITDRRAHSGRQSLAVTFARQTPEMMRVTWQVDISDLRLSSNTRIRFWIYGSRLAQKPHGGLIAVEAGGRQGGGDSHWMATIPSDFYSQEKWQQVTLPPLKEFQQPGWSMDADGRLDAAHISKLLFVAQQEATPELTRPFTFYFDDVEVTDVSEITPTITPATNESRPEHIRPKLRGFVGRERAHRAQVLFSDLSDWQVLGYGSAGGALLRSEEEPLFDRYSGKLTYLSGGNGWLALRPKTPIPLPARFNAIQIWVFGNNWDWVPDPTTPQPEIAVTVRDANGENHRLMLGRVNWKFWGLLHKLIQPGGRSDTGHLSWGGDHNGKIDAPSVFTGIEVRNCGNTQPRALYFDSVAFYQETPPAVKYAPVPAKLPFPTTPDTILPSLTSPVTNKVTRSGDSYLLECRGEGEPLVYRYTPTTGALSDLTCTHGAVSFKPAEGAGPSWHAGGEDLPPTDKRIVRRMLSAIQETNGVRTRWRWSFHGESVEFELMLRVKGRTLIHEWRCGETGLTGISLGRATGLENGRVIKVPYYTVMGTNGAGILYDRGLFASHLVDWYVTDSSGFDRPAETTSAHEAAYGGSAYYTPKTDGYRNPLHERCFLTVSPRFEEVLPNLPNPPTPRADILRNHLYTHLGGTSPDRFDGWLKQLKEYKRYGIDGLIVTQHEDSWTEGADVGQGPEEYTMTLDGPPDAGGDATLQRYYAAVKALGYLAGPYNNYTDYSPLGKSWDEANVTRLPDGEWERVWPPCYGIRPLKAAEMAAHYAPAQARKFGVNTTYCDVHTCVAPWWNVDYQAGTPGAGKMRTTFEAYGRVLMTQRASYGGPAFSEGTHHCFYAGLIDGSYAQMGLPDPPNQPLLLDFDLRKMHPLSADISMQPWAYWDDNEYHCMAATLAYGHIGFFPFVETPKACRYYYLMLAMQRQYTLVPVRDIAYWDGSAFLETSQALPRDANKRGQVRVRYVNGLEVCVNYSASERWNVMVGGKEYALSPCAWVAANGDGFLEFSTEIDGRRVSYVKSSEYTFADAGGKPYDFGEVATDGEVVLKQNAAGGIRLTLIHGTSTVSVSGRFRRCTYRDAEGRTLPGAALSVDGQNRTVVSPPNGALYCDLE